MILPEIQKDYLHWIVERENARIGKETNAPKPWTTDPIIQQYKFCNVRREDDRVTEWLFENWYNRYENNSNLWFGAIVARLFNWPDTLARIGFPGIYGDQEFEDWREAARGELKRIRDLEKGKVFTGAYLVSTNGVKMDKIDYVLDRVLTPIWVNGLAPDLFAYSVRQKITLENYWYHLLQFDGLGSFMAGQVIADLKFYDPILKQATDWWTWAPLGPGSKRGLNRLHGRKLEQGLSQEKALTELQELRTLVENELDMNLAVHNVQNTCCEFDKFMRVKLGEGRPRSLYNGVR